MQNAADETIARPAKTLKATAQSRIKIQAIDHENTY